MYDPAPVWQTHIDYGARLGEYGNTNSVLCGNTMAAASFDRILIAAEKQAFADDVVRHMALLCGAELSEQLTREMRHDAACEATKYARMRKVSREQHLERSSV